MQECKKTNKSNTSANVVPAINTNNNKGKERNIENAYSRKMSSVSSESDISSNGGKHRFSFTLHNTICK